MSYQVKNFLIFAATTLAFVIVLFLIFESQTEFEGEMLGFAVSAGGAFGGYLILLGAFNYFYPLRELIRSDIDFFEDLVGDYDVVSTGGSDKRQGIGRYSILRTREGLNISGHFKLGDRQELVFEETFFAVRGTRGWFWYEIEDGDEEFDGFTRLAISRNPPTPVAKIQGDWTAYSRKDGRRIRGQILLQRVGD